MEIVTEVGYLSAYVAWAFAGLVLVILVELILVMLGIVSIIPFQGGGTGNNPTILVKM